MKCLNVKKTNSREQFWDLFVFECLLWSVLVINTIFYNPFSALHIVDCFPDVFSNLQKLKDIFIGEDHFNSFFSIIYLCHV